MSALRGALHVLALLVLLPYLALATGFLVLGHAIAGGTLVKFFDALLTQATWFMPWGAFSLSAALIAIAVFGIVPGTRWLAAVCLCVLAAGSLIVIVAMNSAPFDGGTLLFLVPCLGVLAFGAVMLHREQQARRLREDPAAAPIAGP